MQDNIQGSTSSAAASQFAKGYASVAALSAILPLLGWGFGLPILRTFGGPAPALPLTCAGVLLLAAALLLRMRGALRASRFAAVLALLLAVTIWVEHLYHVDTGIDRLLFAKQIGMIGSGAPGRPGYISTAVMALLAAAITIRKQSQLAEAAALILASLSLGLGALSLGLVPDAVVSGRTSSQVAFTSLPVALALVLLSTAVLVWRVRTRWTGLFTSTESAGTLILSVLPLILIAPVGTSILELWLVQRTGSALAPEIAGTGLNIILLVGLLLWMTTVLRRQQARLIELTYAFDSAPIMLTDLQGRILHWSRGCEELYGWQAEEALGRNKYELLASRPEEGTGDVRPMDVPSGERHLLEIRSDGTMVRVLEESRRVQDVAVRPILVLSMVDITARVSAEQALRDSEERLALATSAHGLGIFERDVKGGTITWAEGSEERLGLAPGSVSEYASLAALVHPDDVATIRATTERAIAARADHIGFKYRLFPPGGEMRVLEGSSRCFYDEEGDLVRTVGVTIDVTGHEEREAALRAREAQLTSILETVPDPMVIIDERGIIQSFSRAAEELFGYHASEAVGQNVSLIVAGEHKGEHDSYIVNYLRTGEKRVIGRARILSAVRSDGSEIPIELRVGEAMVGDKRLFTGFLRDISGRLQNERRLDSLRDELTQVSRMTAMGEMAAGLAHELNQPLTATVNFLAAADMLLKHGADPTRVQELIDQASSQSLRAGDIIRRLREFIAKGDSDMRAEPVEGAVREAASLVLAGQALLGVRILYDLDPRARLMLADRIQVQQVLVNLLRNSLEALRMTDQGDKEIRIAARALDRDMMEISVSDNGPGIPETVLSRIHTPFISTKGKSGMGLGLSICRRIINAHGGEFVAENLADGGARFRFTLQAVSEEELTEA